MRKGSRSVTRSSSEQFELLSERRLPIAGVFRLLPAHHVNHLDSIQDHTGSDRRLETEHGSDPPLYGAVVLLNAIVQIGTLPDANGFEVTLRSVLDPVCGIAGQYCPTVGLTAVDHDPLGPAMALECLTQKPLGSGEVTPFAEPEFDRTAIAVDRSVKIHPTPADLDVCLVDVPLAGDNSLT